MVWLMVTRLSHASDSARRHCSSFQCTSSVVATEQYATGRRALPVLVFICHLLYLGLVLVPDTTAVGRAERIALCLRKVWARRIAHRAAPVLADRRVVPLTLRRRSHHRSPPRPRR